ncbi:Predicted dehydrogenase [Cryobacterium flavum]|uniref:Gfo/Idh/MocA family oxidoreductase n=1 Tax=Cryobacterium flavum TaxID=1424659 RepID=A0A4R8VDT9_9MICO|nr:MULTISPECIES: Gfo/Idh/MocA family oxidoreductase [Cryobacterium]TFB81073.1 Gfo/Idh/MocA family oxidoreductase [Cryobacterium flavum]SDM77395.1 Predicted dehydrogenase [Cryobacterium flavum]
MRAVANARPNASVQPTSSLSGQAASSAVAPQHPLSERPLRVALMSFAHVHAAGYAALLQSMPNVELRASDPDGGNEPAERRGRGLADDLGVSYVDSYAELLVWQPDAVIVTSENARHRPLVEAAALAGAAVLCEKPLATTLADALAMQAACDAAGVTLMTAYPVRFSPAFARLRELVQAGGLGALLAATGTNNGQIPVGDRAWFTDPALSGGGAMVDHIVHVADLLDALTGLTAQFVRAVSNRILHADKPEVRAETGGLVTISYAGGFVATIDCSWSQPDNAPTWGGLTLQVVGTRGIADIDPFAQHVGGVGADEAVFLGYGKNTDELLLNEFVHAVRAGRAGQPDGAAGIRSLKIVLAAQESARTGEVVSIR